MADRRLSRMDRAREASAQRDAAKKKFPDQIAADLRREADGPVPRPPLPKVSRWTVKYPKCPVCPPSSLSSLTWDGHRGQWWHRQCGSLFGPEEFEDVPTKPVEEK